MKCCADSNLKKVSLELGGKSPLVIFEDADMQQAVRIGMGSVFFNKGENCIAAGKRLLLIFLLFWSPSKINGFLNNHTIDSIKLNISKMYTP